MKHGLRLIGVALTLARHGALFPLALVQPRPALLGIALWVARLVPRRRGLATKRPGERLAMALTALGPAFIKLGQMLATRPDLIGIEEAEDLTRLQDRLPAFDWVHVEAALTTELGAPVDTLYRHIDHEPVAAASIAQVHRAETVDGKDVAVKVLRPGIEARFERDLATFSWAARLIDRTVKRARRLRPVAIVDILAESVRREMDLRLEAAAASELAEDMTGFAGYRIPKVDWARTGRRVLTLEWVTGTRIDDRAALAAAGHDRAALARVAVQAFLTQATGRGFFHADLHQGNLLVDGDGILVAVDFGIMGRLCRSERRYLAEILWGFIARDYARIAAVHFEAGYVPAGQSQADFAQALRAIGEPIMDRPVSEISVGRLLAQLFETTEAFAMETQPQLLLLQKTMVMAEGIALQLDGSVNMWELARPVLETTLADLIGPKAQLQDTIDALIRILRLVPKLAAELEACTSGAGPEGPTLCPDP